MFQLATFMSHVEADDVNDHFTLKRSSLNTLITELQRNPVRINMVIEAVARLRANKVAKAAKYQRALDYLADHPPGGFPAAAFPRGAVPIDWTTRCKAYEPAPSNVYTGYAITSYGTRPVFAPGKAQLVTDVTLITHRFRFECKWKSSDGIQGSLARVFNREHVSFRTDPAEPPFNYINEHHYEDGPAPHYEFSQPRGPSNPMNFASNDDVHTVKDPRFLVARPCVVGRLVLDQSYQYNASGVDDDSHWIDIPNAQYTIVREVVKKSGRFCMRWSKQQALTNAGKILFSHDILIENLPPLLPKHYKDFH